MNRTFAMIKPDAVAGKKAGLILAHIENAGFRIVGMKLKHMSLKEAEGFYAVHKGRGFFEELVTFMSEGPAVLLVLGADGAVTKWREAMGATNPANAAEGTIRKLYAESIGRNAAHGSDSDENAAIEIGYWFSQTELS